MKICYKCQSRHVGCHSECELYLQEKMEHDEKKKEIREIRREEFVGYSGNKNHQKEAKRRWCRNYGV